jgi:hypothetical protein
MNRCSKNNIETSGTLTLFKYSIPEQDDNIILINNF